MSFRVHVPKIAQVPTMGILLALGLVWAQTGARAERGAPSSLGEMGKGSSAPVAAASPTPPPITARPDEAALYTVAKKAKVQAVEGNWSPALCEITRDWAKKMASRYTLSTSPNAHDGFRGGPNSRSDRALNATRASAASEVLASTYGFEKTLDEHAVSCVNGWLESPSHRRELTVKHDHYCLSMEKGGDGKYYCIGIFTDVRK